MSFPEPGAYRGVPAADYHAADALSNSMMKGLLRSPFHCKWSVENPKAPTAEMKLGTLVHTCILQPDLWTETVVLEPEFSGKGSKAAKKEFLATLKPGQELLDADEIAKVLRMSHSLLNHPACGALIKKLTERELSLIWIENGVTCKARLDGFCEELDAIVDLKTTFSAHPEDFPRIIASKGYHRQAAHYLSGANKCGLRAKRFILLAVENMEPHAVAAYRLTKESIEIGEAERQRLMSLYRQCCDTEQWPAYDPALVDLAIPLWAFKKEEHVNAE